MRPSVRYGLVFFGGLVVGITVAWTFVAWQMWNRNLANWYVMGLAGQAYTAREIYVGRSKQRADRIRGTLPTYVRTVEREFRGAEGRDGTYWMVSDVYKASGAEVPTELKPILASLPPRGSCRKPALRVSGAL